MRQGLFAVGFRLDRYGFLLAAAAIALGVPSSRADAGFALVGQFDDLDGSWSRVAIDGDRAVVGARESRDVGYAHFFELGPDGWAMTDTVRGRNSGDAADSFGLAVAIEGDRALIGAPDFGDSSGAAYVFDRQPNGEWLEVNRFEGLVPSTWLRFGYGVELIGSTAIVADRGGSAAGTGNAIFYELAPDGTQTFTQSLAPGCRINSDGSRFICGSDWPAAATVYDLTGTGSTGPGAQLVASDRVDYLTSGDGLGWSVDVLGDVAAAGAIFDSEVVDRGGAVHVWERSGDSWGVSTKINTPEAEAEGFGTVVALGPNLLAVGAQQNSDMGEDAGAVHIYRRTTEGWVPSEKLYSPLPGENYGFGASVDFDNGYLMVGDARGSAFFFKEEDPNAPQTFSTLPVFDVEADSSSGMTVLTDAGYGINVQESAGRRGILEFDLGSIPDGATILSASIRFVVYCYTSAPGYPSAVRLYGYPGNGTPDTADAERTEHLIAVGDPVEELGPQVVPLDATFIQSLLDTSDFLGLLALGSNNNQYGFWSLEDWWAEGSEPLLTIEYTTGDPLGIPGDLNGDGRVGSADLDIVRANWGEAVAPGDPADPSGDGRIGSADLDIVRANWGATAQAATVPEPGMFFLLLAAGVVGLGRAGGRTSKRGRS